MPEKVAHQIRTSWQNSCMRSRSGRVRLHYGPNAGVCMNWSRVFGRTSANIGILSENDDREAAESWRMQFGTYLASQRGREDSTGSAMAGNRLNVQNDTIRAGCCLCNLYDPTTGHRQLSMLRCILQLISRCLMIRCRSHGFLLQQSMLSRRLD